jgi:hypothetical protein
MGESPVPAFPSVTRRSAWCRAATLAERVASRTKGERAAGRDPERGRRRLEQWRGQAPFASNSFFAQRLAQGGLTEQEFLDLLGEPTEAARPEAPPPAWALRIDQAVAHADGLDLPPLPDEWSGRPEVGFLEMKMLRPLIRQALGQLRQGVQALGGSATDRPFDPGTVDAVLFAPLPTRLLEMMLRTLTLELHVARLQGLLDGQTPEERFESFLGRLRQPEVALALYDEYPVLARQLIVCLDH